MTDLTNKKFNKLIALKFVKYIKNEQVWLFKCDCGSIKEIRSRDVIRNKSKSCGVCDKIGNQRGKIHGLRHHALSRIWRNMKDRCYNSKNKAYHNYGGRGIVVCEEWKTNFKIFYDWVIQNGWEECLQIDRINNDGNYEPYNCRWTTNLENSNNKSTNRRITFNNKTQTMAQWARELNISQGCIRYRVENNLPLDNIKYNHSK